MRVFSIAPKSKNMYKILLKNLQCSCIIAQIQEQTDVERKGGGNGKKLSAGHEHTASESGQHLRVPGQQCLPVRDDAAGAGLKEDGSGGNGVQRKGGVPHP